MSLLNIFNFNATETSINPILEHHQLDENNLVSGISTIFNPVENTVSAVSSILNVFPDPTKEGTLYDQINSGYNQIALTLIEVPKTITNGIIGFNLVGDVLSSTVLTALKDVGIVGDHTIMLGAEAVDAVDVTLVGSVNIIDKFLSNPTDLFSLLSNYDTDPIDSLIEIVSHIVSYAVNNAESHLYHDVDLAVSPLDLIIAWANDVEKNTGFKVPVADLLNKIVDGLAVNLQDNISGETFDKLRDFLSEANLKITNVGTMNHDLMDHVGEGNIREGYEREHSGHNSDSNHEHSGNDSSGSHEHSGHNMADNNLLRLLDSNNVSHVLDSSDNINIGQDNTSISDLVIQVINSSEQEKGELDSILGERDSGSFDLLNNISSNNFTIPLQRANFNDELLHNQNHFS